MTVSAQSQLVYQRKIKLESICMVTQSANICMSLTPDGTRPSEH
jgi:hypothetical protein